MHLISFHVDILSVTSHVAMDAVGGIRCSISVVCCGRPGGDWLCSWSAFGCYSSLSGLSELLDTVAVVAAVVVVVSCS